MALVLAWFVLLVCAAIAFAAPGDLDASFGGDGVVYTSFARSSNSFAADSAVQSDGKIVAAGRAGISSGRFAVARYNVDGSLDGTFSGDGKVTTDFTRREDLAYAVAIQSDGKIVAAGRAGGGRGRFALARYNVDGTLDATFSGDGKALTNFSRNDDFAAGVAVQSDGKIVAVGVAGGYLTCNFALARYNTDGTLDVTFSGDGKAVTKLTTRRDFASDLVIQSDGKIVAAGRAGGAFGRFGLVRYDTEGRLDTTFGGDGKVATNFSRREDLANGLAIQSDGKIVAAGTAHARFALARYNDDGSLDAAFGGDGKVMTNVTPAPDLANGLAIQSDGRIVVAGVFVSTGSCCESGNELVRYTSTGTLDNSFAGGGKIVTDFQIAGGANAVVIQSDGKIVVAGRVGTSGSEFALLRYLDV